VREQSALLVANFAISRRARDIFVHAFQKLKELLEDKVLEVREAVAFAFKRLSANDDGCARIVESGAANSMIDSFISHSKDEKALKKDDGQYLIHLLEAFANLTSSDYGIEPLLGKNAIATFTNIISQKYVAKVLKESHR
jgi:hypothetical protein